MPRPGIRGDYVTMDLLDSGHSSSYNQAALDISNLYAKLGRGRDGVKRKHIDVEIQEHIYWEHSPDSVAAWTETRGRDALRRCRDLKKQNLLLWPRMYAIDWV